MQLAMKANLHLNAVGHLERGARSPSLKTVFILSRALGVTPDSLIKEVAQFKLAPLI